MPPRAIVIALDQLSRRCLGCYGHEWIETPHLDRLAARGVVFDQCLASPVPEFSLRHSAETLRCSTLSGAEVRVHWLGHADESEDAAPDDLESTSLATLVRDAEETLVELSRERSVPWLLWLESSGIGWPGLASSQFVELYVDELEDDIPAELFAIREIEVAYAALLTQFDHLLGRLLSVVARLFDEAPPLIILTAARGECVCESEMLSRFADRSGELSINVGSFRDELVHPPLIIVGATRETLGSRRDELVSPIDVLPTLKEWFGVSSQTVAENDAVSLLPLLRNEGFSRRSELLLQDTDGRSAVRTDQFLFVAQAIQSGDELDSDDTTGLLFLKPEDVWEVNNIAAQHPEQVARLQAAVQTRLRPR